MLLLSPDRLIVTGPVDKASWNYTPWLSWLQRRRFALLLELVADRQFGTILEVGYGSGVFMPELSRRCAKLIGIDVHERAADVRQVLRSCDVETELYQCSAEDMWPIAENSVDLVVAVSALEYVPDKLRLAEELQRVLAPSGMLAFVQPTENVALDLALRVLTGEQAAQYGSGRTSLVPALATAFTCSRELRFPRHLPGVMTVYVARSLIPKPKDVSRNIGPAGGQAADADRRFAE